ncbi:MAG: antitermination protein NusG, partial [Treponema sp.]|nr:antitermination protein NusG [Treponema sp.]
NHPEISVNIFFPTRRITVRSRGKASQRTAAVFPGYLFVEIPPEDSIFRFHWSFRRTEGFFRFLKSNQNILPLKNRDLETVLHFITREGAQAGISKVYFNEKSRIVVVEGPLAGLEGSIVKVDKRRGRAKIKLDLYDESFSIDLGFEVIQPAHVPKPAF